MIPQARRSTSAMKTFYWIPVVMGTAVMAAVASCAADGGDGGTETAAENSGAGGGSSEGTGGITNTGQGGTGNIAVEPTGGMGPIGVGGAGGGGGMTSDGGSTGTGTGTGGTTINPMCAPDPKMPRTFYMSADDSSSMGSATVAREYLRAGLAPPPALIRPYEFLNYYRVKYPLPADDKLGVHVAFASGTNGAYRFQVGVQAHEVTRPDMAITFAVDTSGSLVGQGIERARAAIKALAGRLDQGDVVNFVTWANEDSELLVAHPVAGPSDPQLLAVADALAPGGGSDLHAGLTRGYELAGLTKDKDRLSRLVLISDGGANLGVLDRTTIAEAAEDGEAEGIYLVGVGVGPAIGYSDVLMNAVTDAGRGSYVYLDSVEEAEPTLGERFVEVMDIAARNVQIAVKIPTYFEIETSSGESYSDKPQDIRPQHIAPADSMVLNQILTIPTGQPMCEYDLIGVQVTWNDPLLHASTGQNSTVWEGEILEVTGEPWQLLKAEAIFAYARALQLQTASDLTLASDAVKRALAHAEIGEDPYKAELDEIGELIASFPEEQKP